ISETASRQTPSIPCRCILTLRRLLCWRNLQGRPYPRFFKSVRGPGLTYPWVQQGIALCYAGDKKVLFEEIGHWEYLYEVRGASRAAAGPPAVPIILNLPGEIPCRSKVRKPSRASRTPSRENPAPTAATSISPIW